MTLATSLSGKLDAQSLVDGLGSNLSGPLASLGSVSSPVNTDDLHTAVAGTSSIDASPVGAAVHQLATLAGPVLQTLPVVGDFAGPIVDVIDLLEKAVGGELTTALGSLRGKVTGAFGSDGDPVGAIIRVSQVLGGAPEGRVALDVVRLAASIGRIRLPTQIPFGDLVLDLTGLVHLVGGLMALDTILVRASALAAASNGQIDASQVQASLASLQAVLDGTGTSLADAVSAADANDPAQVAAALTGATTVANALDAIGAGYTRAIALSEAALVQLDAGNLGAKLDAASAALRSAELDALDRSFAALAALLGPLTSLDLVAALGGTFDGILAGLESRVADLAANVRAATPAQVVAPVTNAIDMVTGLIHRLSDVITQITVTFQSAMNTVKNAIAALPVQSIVGAIDTFLQPITTVLGNIERIIDQVHAALEIVANATQQVIGQVGTILDGFKNDVDTLFGGARDFVVGLNLDAVVGKITDGIRAFSDEIAKAQLKPYFDTADGAISTAADVISKIPFGVLPDSMKQQVDDALEPIKDADASALETEIEGLLDLQPDPSDPNKRVLAVRDIVNQAIHDVQTKYDDLLATIKTYDPHKYLQDLDAKLAEVGTAVQSWQPALTLQPLTDAVNQVKSAIVGFDLAAQLAPVHDVFAQIEAKVAEFDPTHLVQPIEDRIVAVRTQIFQVTRLNEWIPAIDRFSQQLTARAGLFDPNALATQLQAAISDGMARLSAASVPTAGSIGSGIAPLTRSLGLQIDGTTFGDVVAWLGGAPGDAALTALARTVASTLAQARDGVQALDLATMGTPVVERTNNLASALTALAARLPSDSPSAAALTALAPRVRAEAVLGALGSGRDHLLASLQSACEATQPLQGRGFSEATDAANKWRAAVVPLQPVKAYVGRQLAELGIGPGLSLSGVVHAVLSAIPVDRVVGTFTPILGALQFWLNGIASALDASVKPGIQSIIDLINQVDLKPLTDAIEGVFGEVQTQIAALDPDNLLAAPLAAFKKLQDDLATQDPMQQVLEIVTNLRNAVAALLLKLDSNKLLETPLQIYDTILADLSKLSIEGLLDPVFNQLDGIAEQVHEGLDNTVTAFVRLQQALPGADGGTAAAGGAT